jgi:hypothetical protein
LSNSTDTEAAAAAAAADDAGCGANQQPPDALPTGSGISSISGQVLDDVRIAVNKIAAVIEACSARLTALTAAAETVTGDARAAADAADQVAAPGSPADKVTKKKHIAAAGRQIMSASLATKAADDATKAVKGLRGALPVLTLVEQALCQLATTATTTATTTAEGAAFWRWAFHWHRLCDILSESFSRVVHDLWELFCNNALCDAINAAALGGPAPAASDPAWELALCDPAVVAGLAAVDMSAIKIFVAGCDQLSRQSLALLPVLDIQSEVHAERCRQIVQELAEVLHKTAIGVQTARLKCLESLTNSSSSSESKSSLAAIMSAMKLSAGAARVAAAAYPAEKDTAGGGNSSSSSSKEEQQQQLPLLQEVLAVCDFEDVNMEGPGGLTALHLACAGAVARRMPK